MKKDAALDYPYATPPEPGRWLAIDEDTMWLRMPLPFALAHINLWLVRDGEGWATVDTGMRSKEAIEVWEGVHRELLAGGELTRVIVTHMHPDHVGMAGWLCERGGSKLWMSQLEYLLCRVLVADTGKQAPTDGVAFYRAAGLDGEQVERYKKLFGQFGRAVYWMPDSYVRIRDGDTIPIGKHSFEVVGGNGHSPEHACLYDQQRNLLISGDQILPTISSNVSVWPTEPNANPLHDWLASCARLRERLPADVLVLPAHGKPFRGVHTRLTQLIDEHEKGLEDVRTVCTTPQRAVDLFEVLFNSRITDGNRIMATGEAVANINYLLATGDLVLDEVRDGAHYYRAN